MTPFPDKMSSSARIPAEDLERWGSILAEAEGCIKALSKGIATGLPRRLREEYLLIARHLSEQGQPCDLGKLAEEAHTIEVKHDPA